MILYKDFIVPPFLGRGFFYSKPRLSSLAEEQNIAKGLKQELEKHYGINKIPVHQNYWHTIVNSYVYGNYPINAIIKAIKFKGKTVHFIIPSSAWQKVRDYINWIKRESLNFKVQKTKNKFNIFKKDKKLNF